jgi:hypothetical protein
MRLVGSEGQVLQLALDGYQFPGEAQRADTANRAAKAGLIAIKRGDPHDDNWLFVRGRVETTNGSWEFRDPCLLTWEARELADWLRRASHRQVCRNLGFLEPNLAFDLAEPAAGEWIRLVVSFGWEARPPWVTRDVYEHTPVDFKFLGSDLAAAALELDANLAEYPER